jgi:hypothetical protein
MMRLIGSKAHSSVSFASFTTPVAFRTERLPSDHLSRCQPKKKPFYEAFSGVDGTSLELIRKPSTNRARENK